MENRCARNSPTNRNHAVSVPELHENTPITLLFLSRGDYLNALERWLLKRFCDKHGLDFQEIDSTLTYYENKQHLCSLVMGPLFPDVNLRVWRSQMERYQREHILEYYVSATLDGETKSDEVGKPYYPRFSLAMYIQLNS